MSCGMIRHAYGRDLAGPRDAASSTLVCGTGYPDPIVALAAIGRHSLPDLYALRGYPGRLVDDGARWSAFVAFGT